MSAQPARTLLNASMDFYKVPGVSLAVIDRGEIVLAESHGVMRTGDPQAVTPATLFQAASIGKPVTAVAALRLVESGRLSLDADVNESLASWKIPSADIAEGEPVTLRRLLSHTAGLTMHSVGGYVPGAPCPSLLQILQGMPPSKLGAVRIATKPGARSRYSGGGYCVAQQLLIDVTGENFPALLHRLVLQPAGMTSSTFEQTLPPSLLSRATAGHRADGRRIEGDAHVFPGLAAAGLWSTPTDLARFVLKLQSSLLDQSGLLSRAMAETMLTPVQPGGNFGLGPVIKGKGEKLFFMHTGGHAGFRCLLLAMPHQGRGLVVMTNSDRGQHLFKGILHETARKFGWSSSK